VPLDGSALAEQALPLAHHIAGRTGAALHLIHVHILYLIKERIRAWVPYDPKYDLQCVRQEQAYLDGVVQRFPDQVGTRVTTAVVQGTPVDAILAETRQRRADLIVMATRQHDRLARFEFGSTADEVVRQAPVAVVLVPSREPVQAPSDEPTPRHMLIPLDGSALAEEVLEPALQLGRDLDVRYTLLRVVKRTPLDGDDSRNGQGRNGREPYCEEARVYLESVARRLRAKSIPVETRVVGGHAGDGILWGAGRVHADLIALATHAYGGFKRLLVGSVADHIHRNSAIPVMIHRASSCRHDVETAGR